MRRKWVRLLLVGMFILIASAGISEADNLARARAKIRVGYFPNITHAQALIGMADGTFQKELGNKVEIQKFIFNAGPSVIEAMMARQLDLAYIGPNPAINGYIKTNGALLRIIAGASSGGAALVVRGDMGVKDVSQLAGEKIASPQLGNTQDVSLRFYLKKHGIKLVEEGGATQVLPIANPDQLTLFQKKEIAAAWTVEPWVSRLVNETKGVILVDERSLWPGGKFTTANIIVSREFLKKYPQTVKKWLRAHVKITRRINSNLAEAERLVNQQICQITGQPLPEEIVTQAFNRFEVTYDPLVSTLMLSADHAFELGFLGKAKPNLEGIYDLRLLNEVLAEMKLPPLAK